MTTVPSATTWGSPTAKKQALLIHGLTSSSHTWHRVATSLAEQGYLVTAPNLIGHMSRAAPDYHFSAIADDLLPYLEAQTYDLIIGHSLGGTVALHLLPHLPRTRPTAIVLVDSTLDFAPAELDAWERRFMDTCTYHESAEAHCAANPLLTREDGIYKALAMHLCPPTTPAGVLSQNRPWHFLDCLANVSDKWKVSVLRRDPAVPTLYRRYPMHDLEPYPHVRRVVVPGAGHCIQSEFPDAVVREALKRVAELDAVA